MESLKDKLIKMQKGAYLHNVKSDLEQQCKTKEEFELLDKIKFVFIEFASWGNDDLIKKALSGCDISPFLAENNGTIVGPRVRFPSEPLRLFSEEELRDRDRKEADSDKNEEVH